MDKMKNYFKSSIKKNEGLKLFPYKCSSNKITIGFGHNLSDCGISEDIAIEMFDVDYEKALNNVKEYFDNFDSLVYARKFVLIDMCFNLGIYGLLKFRKMINEIEKCNWNLASYEITNSKYYKQVEYRAQKNRYMMKNGIFFI